MNSEDKILIVDDQPSVRFGLRSLLEAEGYRALEAETGEQAISLITEQSPQSQVARRRWAYAPASHQSD